MKELLDKYIGLKEEDLDKDNPEYSCIICKAKCLFAGDCSEYACQHNEMMSSDEWNEYHNRNNE